MMENDFSIKQEGTTLYVYLGYELMTENSPVLQEEMKNYQGQDIKKIVYDATDLVFISSSGIRVITYAYQKIGHLPKIEFVNCAKKIYETLDLIGITNLINFVEDESRKQQVTNAEVQERINKVNQEQLDYFAANNDVVMYQMKLGQEDD
jgi:anti-anti-sigma factor